MADALDGVRALLLAHDPAADLLLTVEGATGRLASGTLGLALGVKYGTPGVVNSAVNLRLSPVIRDGNILAVLQKGEHVQVLSHVEPTPGGIV